MPEMTAVQHAVCYSEWDDRQKVRVHKTLRRGETANVPDEEIARVEAIREKELADHLAGRHVDHRAGQVRWVPKDEYDEYTSTAAVERDPISQFTDEEITAWDPETSVAQMNRLPGLAQRVLDLEEQRKPRRRAVVAHAQRLLDASDGGDVSLAPADTSAQPLLPAEDA